MQLTPNETAQMRQMTKMLMSLTPDDLRAAHDAWRSAARQARDPTPDAARRLIMAHVALETAVRARLENIQTWQDIAFREAFGDILPSPGVNAGVSRRFL